jgi:hypothetical protein
LRCEASCARLRGSDARRFVLERANPNALFVRVWGVWGVWGVTISEKAFNIV